MLPVPQLWTDARAPTLPLACCLSQFRSISNELYGTQEHHLDVRNRVVSHIRWVPTA